ncbi:MAG: MBL fold metallo-hydrolase [Bdellovibrionales bacterium]|nr:MBL fold metallo-hydrolase [Bdellovibrionales bacterium]
MKKYTVKSVYDEITATVTHIVFDQNTLDAVVIDPVLDYDPASSKIFFDSVHKIETFIKKENLSVHLCLETHAHADHLSGAQELKKRFPQIKIAIGSKITEVQMTFKKVFNLPDFFVPNGSQFDLLLDENSFIHAGSIEIKVISTPGHTPACISYWIGDALFTGDALFMPDTGTGRCDFPSGSAQSLYESIVNKLYKLPDSLRVFVGHDYKGNGTREAKWETTLEQEKLYNIQLKAYTTKEDYVRLRQTRDSTLAAPRLLLPSIQINIDGGRLPAPEENGVSYIKLPIKSR